MAKFTLSETAMNEHEDDIVSIKTTDGVEYYDEYGF